MEMEILLLEALLTIFVLWLVLTVGIILINILIRRRKRSNNSGVRCASANAVNPRRIIQIYYIGSPDSIAAVPPPNVGYVMDEIMSNVEDLPPSYEEIAEIEDLTNTDENNMKNFRTNPIDLHSIPPSIPNAIGENVVVMVD
ncbi:unnamed protein product [Orchesella dallaii]|uniref:Uncharacterized protein n=1 Tax=Orchesella dallaii TaxID=48710 RepID=A0ABP1RDF0_9HEXA